MNVASRYNINIKYGLFDGEECYEATVKEFPDLAEYGDSYEEVYSLLIDSINTTLLIFKEKNKKIPEPQTNSYDDFSGRLTLRIPKSLHRKLFLVAEKENVSLNQYLVSIIAYAIGKQYENILNLKSYPKYKTNKNSLVENFCQPYFGLFNKTTI